MAQRKNTPSIDTSPEKAAALAGLIYVLPAVPGYTRVRCGRGFRFVDAGGITVRNRVLITRFKALVIPPAWQRVWICPFPNGHLQATGFDERGRKQYRYHSKWREQRDSSKFEKMLAFGHGLPSLRSKIETCLRERTLSKAQVLATVVYLLEKTLIRIGNETYAQANGSYGLTTMRDEHVDVDRSIVHFEFKGKSGIEHKVSYRHPRIATIVSRCQELPGQILFQYREADGEARPVGSEDVNQFLQETMGEMFSAKDFRTWHASVMALKILKSYPTATNKTQCQRLVKQAIAEVAKNLRNTVAICRKSYVHPAVIESYIKGELHQSAGLKANRSAQPLHLSHDELLFLDFMTSRSAPSSSPKRHGGVPRRYASSAGQKARRRA